MHHQLMLKQLELATRDIVLSLAHLIVLLIAILDALVVVEVLLVVLS